MAKKKIKILTVDDEIGIISFLYDFFVARDFEVLQATNGKEALNIIRKEKPPIVLLDIKLGRGMSGIDVLKEIRGIDKDIKVIMMTGVKDKDVTDEAMGLGATDYITKPLSLAYLDKVVLLKALNLQMKDLAKGD
ncbi:MAG: response regulator [Candidatus Omnitrophica bacterium]|nr:response regulator [Candidatus Omnitrophota bacterium]